MTRDFDKLITDYSYNVPEGLIAQAPAQPRDSAKVLIYKLSNQAVFYDTFANIGAYLPAKSVLVINETKVLPARLAVHKETGGLVELLYIGSQGSLIEALTNKAVSPGSKLLLTDDISFQVDHCEKSHVWLRPSFASDQLFSVLERYGVMPLPPYIKKTPLSEKQLHKQYQTVFARERGSVAAPTASLHFSKKLLSDLKKQGHEIVRVTLHVNLGTFAPLTEEQVVTERLHGEYYSISDDAARIINLARKQNQSVIAVGTTVARTLESAVDKRGWITHLSGLTDLFIRPGYSLKAIDGLITNFHVPRSSLLMLVATLTGREKLLELYQKAIDRQFRLFSFGDAMVIIP